MDVDDDLGRLLARVRLEPHAEPAAPTRVASEAPRGDGLRTGEAALGLSSLLAELLHQLRELECEHRLEPLAADVALRGAVEVVAHRHVVGRDGLGDRSSRTAGCEERTRDLLATADLGERAVR